MVRRSSTHRLGGIPYEIPTAVSSADRPRKPTRYDRHVLVRPSDRARTARQTACSGERPGSGDALVLRGGAGDQAEALLHFAEGRADGMRVLHARGVEAEAKLPFSGPAKLLRPLLDLLERFPTGEPTPSEERSGSRRRSTHGSSSARERSPGRSCRPAPLLCVIDDAHWLDAASSDAFVFVARRLEADSVAILFAAREEEARPFEPPGIEELLVTGLDRGEAVELLRGSGLPERVVVDLHRAATGNPLALLELPGALNEKQRAGTGAASGTAAGAEGCPGSVRAPDPGAAGVDPARARRRCGRAFRAAFPDRTGLCHSRPRLVRSRIGGGRGAADDRRCARRLSASARQEQCRLHTGTPTERRRVHAALRRRRRCRDIATRRAWHLVEAAVGPDEDVAATLEQAALGA